MRKIGIMGGTFDPIHSAHLLIAEAAREEFGLDEIIFVTSGNPPHKRESRVTPAGTRHEMVCAAMADNPYFTADDYEVRKNGYSYTSDTLLYYKSRFPGAALYFIIGADSLAYMHEWHRPDIIIANSVILTYPRAGDISRLVRAARQRLKGNIMQIHSPRFEVSSTMVRERVQNGESIRYLVPNEVIALINRYNLYKD